MDYLTSDLPEVRSGNWFGVGVGTHVMPSDYAIVVDGTGKVTEHLLGHHTAGTVLGASIKVLNNTVQDGKRTVVMTRPLAGPSMQHHSFSPTQLSIDFITALGSTPTFGYHKSKTVGTIALWPKTPSATPAGIGGYFRSNKAAGQQLRNNWAGEIGSAAADPPPIRC